jgi:hypothetical protein
MLSSRRSLNRLEAVSAVLAAVFGVAGLSRSLSLPVTSGRACDISAPERPCNTVSMTFPELYGRDGLIWIAFVALAFVSIAVCGIWHSRTGRDAPGVGLLFFGGLIPVFVSSPTFPGATLMFPSVVCVIVAMFVALWRIWRPAPAH